MAGRILVVDDVATNRIVMKVKLSAACYTVEQAEDGASALRAAKQTQPDLILLDVMMPDLSGVEVCRRLKADPATAEIPIILITALSDHDAKMDGLEAGADDFLTKPVEEVTLLARVRSLLRARDNVRELKMGAMSPDTFGFAEPMGGFKAKAKPARVGLVAPGPNGAVRWHTSIAEKLGAKVDLLSRETVLSLGHKEGDDLPELYVIAVDLAGRNEGLRLLSDLRSRSSTRHAATIMLLPEGDSERAAIALDLGASDVLHEPMDAQELALRIAVQLERKREADRMRAGVRAGLEAAVTDPLTGLYNRRYAGHRMEQMMAEAGVGLAVMMVDLDYFKSVNDTYGHAVGDSVLRQVADRLRGQVRGGDLLARVGGEEFLVVLTNAEHSGALECAERLRSAIGERPFDVGKDTLPRHLTVSVGVSYASPFRLALGEVDAEALIAEADHALYDAKEMGRDQVIQAAG